MTLATFHWHDSSYLRTKRPPTTHPPNHPPTHPRTEQPIHPPNGPTTICYSSTTVGTAADRWFWPVLEFFSFFPLKLVCDVGKFEDYPVGCRCAVRMVVSKTFFLLTFPPFLYFRFFSLVVREWLLVLAWVWLPFDFWLELWRPISFYFFSTFWKKRKENVVDSCD